MKQDSDEVDLRSLPRRPLHDDKVTLKQDLVYIKKLTSKNDFVEIKNPEGCFRVYFIVVPTGIEPVLPE
jgi:hypothetical protein